MAQVDSVESVVLVREAFRSGSEDVRMSGSGQMSEARDKFYAVESWRVSTGVSACPYL